MFTLMRDTLALQNNLDTNYKVVCTNLQLVEQIDLLLDTRIFAIVSSYSVTRETLNSC
jgi:hypothetical protein